MLTEEQARNFIETGRTVKSTNPFDTYSKSEYEYHHMKDHLIPAAKRCAAIGTDAARNTIRRYIENHKTTHHIDLLGELIGLLKED